MNRLYWLVALPLVVVACDKATGPDIEAPDNLTYRLEPSGDPQIPAGMVLEWDGVTDAALTEYRVYSRAADNAPYDLRASTTSTTFHDKGKPDLDYYVTAVGRDGGESVRSNTVRIDERQRLPAPTTITSTSLNGAVHLGWSDNAFLSRPSGFKWYRIYSTSYSLDTDLCGTSWSIEGTTVAAEFLAANMTNGEPRCFAVSAESLEGFESLWSPLRADTPRPDARNVLIDLAGTNRGFRFWLDTNGDGKATGGELGQILPTAGSNMDFRMYVDVSNVVWIEPVRAGTTLAIYGNAPVADLTSVDVAPTTGFAASAAEAVPGWGYVFQMSGGDGFARFGGLRITHASADYVIFDWSFQTDPGNPELSIRGGLNAYDGGVTVNQR